MRHNAPKPTLNPAAPQTLIQSGNFGEDGIARFLRRKLYRTAARNYRSDASAVLFRKFEGVANYKLTRSAETERYTLEIIVINDQISALTSRTAQLKLHTSFVLSLSMGIYLCTHDLEWIAGQAQRSV